MVLLSVVNSVNMSLMERIGEFGTLRALGDRSRPVFRLILTESALLGLLGSALGIAIGIVVAMIITAAGIPMPAMPNSNIGYSAIQLTPMLVGKPSWWDSSPALLPASFQHVTYRGKPSSTQCDKLSNGAKHTNMNLPFDYNEAFPAP